jgi:adenylate cyclase
VRDHIGNRLDLNFKDPGEHMLKNIERPSHLPPCPQTSRRSNVEFGTQLFAPERQKPLIAVLPFANIP